MTTFNATYTSKDHNSPDGTLVYWFDVDGESYGVVCSDEGGTQVVDCDGCPSTDYDVDMFTITEDMKAE